MKKLFAILNLLICFELVVGPNFPGLKIFSAGVARADDCPAGLTFDSTLNRCITSDQQAELINATSSCNGDKECYKRIAEEKLKEGEAEGKIAEEVKNKGGLVSGLGKVLAVGVALNIAAFNLTKAVCMNPSGAAMTAGAIAFVLGDMMANKKHKSCLKKIRDDWEKNKAATTEKTSSGITKVSMSQDQSEAFEMLAKSEECMKSSAKMKSGFYAAATLAYTASGVMAIMEMTNPTGFAGKCIFGATESHDLMDFKYAGNINHNISTSPDLAKLIANSYDSRPGRTSCATVDEYESLRSAFDKTEMNTQPDLLGYLKLAMTGIKNEFVLMNDAEAVIGVAALNTPMARAAISGVLAGMSAMMWMHANKQARIAGNRAEYLRKLKQDFNDSLGAISCSAEERNLPSNANCYCYTEGGQRNSARGNSQVCQQLWSGQSIAKAGDYNTLDFSNQKVCISSSGSADETCACKASKSCLNAIPSVSGNLGVGAISVASNGLKPVNDLANGNVGAGNINGAAILQGAARLLDKKNELAKKAGIDPKKSEKLARDFEKDIMTSAGGATLPSRSASNLPLNMSPSDAARALEKELNNEGRSFENIGGAPALAQPGSKAVEDDGGFKFENPEQPAGPTDADKLAEVMKEDYNYNNNDITKSDSNIFNILSNRYQRSGMRRLFDENGKAAPDAAAKSDIAQ